VNSRLSGTWLRGRVDLSAGRHLSPALLIGAATALHSAGTPSVDATSCKPHGDLGQYAAGRPKKMLDEADDL